MNNNQSITPQPFIIWTLQRTGGTNLTQRLVVRSGFPVTPHEPFNIGRAYGHITEQWLKSKKEAVLLNNMRTIVKNPSVIKHCVEKVPFEISVALANAAIEQGYKHLFLYRKNARDRLLSLHFAEQTGIWGPKKMQKENLDDISMETPIDIRKLIDHECKSVTLLQRTWHYLIEQKVQPIALSFEEVYQTNISDAAATLLPVLQALGLSKNQNDDNVFIEEILGRGEQGSRSKYETMLGVAELEAALSKVPTFIPNMMGVDTDDSLVE